MFPHSQMSHFQDPFFHQAYEPFFGMGLHSSDFLSDRIVPRAGMHHLSTGYRRPWAIARQALAVDTMAKNSQKNLHIGKDGFQAIVDVHHFGPSEIEVKIVDHTVIIEGKHEERDDDHGSVQRHFVRKYTLPEEFDMNTVHSSLSCDGVLTIKAPPPKSITGGNERSIPITHTNIPAHLAVKDNKPHDEPMDDKQL